MALMKVDELQNLIAQTIQSDKKILEVEKVAVGQAQNRVLAQDVLAQVAVPPQNVSAMDGYALAHEAHEGDVFEMIGESVAGRPFVGQVVAHQCVRIMTGAVVPADTCTVVMQENTARQDQKITVHQVCREGNNIRFRGEEIAENETVLSKGRIVRDADVMLLSAIGVAEVWVYRKLKVAVLSTGDELQEIGTARQASDRIYDSNRPMLVARLQDLPVEIVDLGRVADDLESVLAVLKQAEQQADVLLTSGGVSVGDYDFLREAVAQIGKIHHYKVALKPGKPFVFGQMSRVWYFGLPGNPVSGFVGFDLFIKLALWQLAGALEIPPVLRFQAKLTAPVTKNHQRMDIQRAHVFQDEKGEWQATPHAHQDSHRIWGLSRANAYLILPEESGAQAVGASVTVQPFFQAFL